MLEEAFASGRIADAILALMAVEAIVFTILGRRLKWPSSGGALVAGLAAGACLILALRGALTDAAWQTVAAFLILGLIAHVMELRLWFGSRGSSPAAQAGLRDNDDR